MRLQATFLLLNMQKEEVSQGHTRCSLCSPTADPQSLFPALRERNAGREESGLFFFFLYGKTICPNLQRDVSHHSPSFHLFPSLVPISGARHPLALSQTRMHINTLPDT